MTEPITSIRAEFVIGISEGERVTRVAAIEPLEDAMRRHEPGALRIFLQRKGAR